MSRPNYVIKSFKYDGHLHRTWMENWLIPSDLLELEHAQAQMLVCVNHNTMIQEANGKQWQSRIPGITFFLPDEWFNVVALIEQAGVRFYCNIASRPLLNGNVITYIDYDLDVVLYPDGRVVVVDRDEYVRNAKMYRYPESIMNQIELALQSLLERIERREAPFHAEHVLKYFQLWKMTVSSGS